MPETDCQECGETFEHDEYDDGFKPMLCPACEDDEFDRALASVEPPEGGYARGSDMDRL